MANSFTDTIGGHTLDFDLTRGVGARDVPGLCTDLFYIIIRMREAEDLGSPEALRKLILFYIDALKKNCTAIGIPGDTVHEVVYAIVALIDEAVLSVPGACRDYWVARPLQLDLFGDNIAGEEFYKKLEKALARIEKQKDVVEIYYLCLSLGFEGKYKIRDAEERVTIIDETGRKLRRARIRPSSHLSPHGNRQDFLPKDKARRAVFPLWVGAVIAGCVCVAVYFAMSMLTSFSLEEIVKIVEQLHVR